MGKKLSQPLSKFLQM